MTPHRVALAALAVFALAYWRCLVAISSRTRTVGDVAREIVESLGREGGPRE